jgi:hypothetical protein
MRLDGIAIGDIVKTSIGGRVAFGVVLEIRDRTVYFDPISRGSGWRHASAHQVVDHWRKSGRRRAAGDGDDGASQPPEQLALRINT